MGLDILNMLYPWIGGQKAVRPSPKIAEVATVWAIKGALGNTP